MRTILTLITLNLSVLGVSFEDFGVEFKQSPEEVIDSAKIRPNSILELKHGVYKVSYLFDIYNNLQGIELYPIHQYRTEVFTFRHEKDLIMDNDFDDWVEDPMVRKRDYILGMSWDEGIRTAKVVFYFRPTNWKLKRASGRYSDCDVVTTNGKKRNLNFIKYEKGSDEVTVLEDRHGNKQIKLKDLQKKYRRYAEYKLKTPEP